MIEKYKFHWLFKIITNKLNNSDNKIQLIKWGLDDNCSTRSKTTKNYAEDS